MKNLTTKAAAIIIVVGIIAFANSFAQTAREWSPEAKATAQIAVDRREQEAQVTATYIAVLSSEVVSDTQNTHTLAREKEQRRASQSAAVSQVAASALSAGVWVVWFAASLSLIGLAMGLFALFNGVGHRVQNWGRVIPLEDKTSVLALPGGQWRQIEPRAGGRNADATKEDAGCQMAALDVLKFQMVTTLAVIGASSEAVLSALTKRLPPPTSR